MTNAMGGTALAYEVMESIATEYGWPDFHPVIHTPIKLDPVVLARYVGNYVFSPNFSIAVTLEGDQLMVEGLTVIPGAKEQPKFPLFPESQNKFFLKVMKTQLEFIIDHKGQVSYMFLHQGGRI
jgi:hypothetical protein